MNDLPRTSELVSVARRLVWFLPPEHALREPYLFLAHVMTYGTVEDVLAVKRAVGMEPFRETLQNAPAGIFDPRSWAYWNLFFGSYPPPPVPGRQLPGA